MRITDLFLYPLKSAGGISVDRVELDRFGPALDRRWMLVDGDGDFMTQRAHPGMAHLEVALRDGGIQVSAQGHGSTHVPQASGDEEGLDVHLWESGTRASVLRGARSTKR